MSADGAEWVYSPWALVLAVCASVVANGVCGRFVYLHLSHWSAPRQQVYIVRILNTIPVYSVASCLCLRFPGDAAVYFEVLRDVYEAFVVYSFMMLVLEYAGGDASCVQRMIHEPALRHPCPLCCLPPMPRDGTFLRRCKRGVLQFVILKPVTAALSAVMLSAGLYRSPGYQNFLLVAYNASYTVALYFLFVFYLGTKKMLTGRSPVAKFAAIKLVVFATYYQSLAVLFAPGMTHEAAVLWNDFILCLEMVGFALLLGVAFHPREYMDGDATDGGHRWLGNLREVVSVRDVVADINHSFKPTYQDYVLHRVDTKGSGRTPVKGDLPAGRPKPYMAGSNLLSPAQPLVAAAPSARSPPETADMRSIADAHALARATGGRNAAAADFAAFPSDAFAAPPPPAAHGDGGGGNNDDDDDDDDAPTGGAYDMRPIEGAGDASDEPATAPPVTAPDLAEASDGSDEDEGGAAAAAAGKRAGNTAGGSYGSDADDSASTASSGTGVETDDE